MPTVDLGSCECCGSSVQCASGGCPWPANAYVTLHYVSGGGAGGNCLDGLSIPVSFLVEFGVGRWKGSVTASGCRNGPHIISVDAGCGVKEGVSGPVTLALSAAQSSFPTQSCGSTTYFNGVLDCTTQTTNWSGTTPAPGAPWNVFNATLCPSALDGAKYNAIFSP
jgi:hypothetical protein